ncbi:MAG: hypothetical protein RLZZ180_1827 [Pseudomonadota bacterium]
MRSLRRLLATLGPFAGLLLALLLLEQALLGLSLALLLPLNLLLQLLLNLLLILLRLHGLGPGLPARIALLVRADLARLALWWGINALLRALLHALLCPALYPLGDLGGSPLTDIALEKGLLPVDLAHRSPMFEPGLPHAIIDPKPAAAVLFTLGQ